MLCAALGRVAGAVRPRRGAAWAAAVAAAAYTAVLNSTRARGTPARIVLARAAGSSSSSSSSDSDSSSSSPLPTTNEAELRELAQALQKLRAQMSEHASMSGLRGSPDYKLMDEEVEFRQLRAQLESLTGEVLQAAASASAGGGAAAEGDEENADDEHTRGAALVDHDGVSIPTMSSARVSALLRGGGRRMADLEASDDERVADVSDVLSAVGLSSREATAADARAAAAASEETAAARRNIPRDTEWAALQEQWRKLYVDGSVTDSAVEKLKEETEALLRARGMNEEADQLSARWNIAVDNSSEQLFMSEAVVQQLDTLKISDTLKADIRSVHAKHAKLQAWVDSMVHEVVTGPVAEDLVPLAPELEARIMAQLEDVVDARDAPSEGALTHAIGRRKSSTARVWLSPGDGVITINKRPFVEYFASLRQRLDLLQPFDVTSTLGVVNVNALVSGGGPTGQIEAVRLGIAKALASMEPSLKAVLKSQGLLTRDNRVVERKKPGRHKARKRFQWKKR